MPNNRVIYIGTVILVVAVLVWIGAELAKRVEWILPYAAGVGVTLIVAGFIYELWKSRAAKQNQEQPPPEADIGQP